MKQLARAGKETRRRYEKGRVGGWVVGLGMSKLPFRVLFRILVYCTIAKASQFPSRISREDDLIVCDFFSIASGRKKKGRFFA